MKKGLLSLFGASLIASSLFAEDTVDTAVVPEVDTTIDLAWFDSALNETFSVYLEQSMVQKCITDLTTNDCNWEPSNDANATNKVLVEGGKLTITHERIGTGDQYTGVSLSFIDWRGGTGVKFELDTAVGADTVAGMYVDLSEDVIVTAKVSASEECDLRLDLRDVNGHTGNSGTERKTIAPGDAKLYEWDFAEELYDWYGGDFWGTSNGRYGATALTVGDYSKKYGAQAFIPCDVSKIALMTWGINDAGQGTINKEVIVEISEIVVGDADMYDPVTFIPGTDTANIVFDPANVIKAKAADPRDEPTVSVEEEVASIVVYPNPATDVINVEGFATVSTLAGVVVAEGEETVDVSALAAGLYIVATKEGIAQVIIE